MVDSILCNLDPRSARVSTSNVWRSHDFRWTCNMCVGVVHWQCHGVLYSQFGSVIQRCPWAVPANASSVAELVSAYPTAGGMYYVTKHVVPPEHVAAWAWIIGWCNFLGQAAGVASLAYTISQMILATAVMHTFDGGEATYTP